MTPETQSLLYRDETGELVGVLDVQLMDPVPAERIHPVRQLLGDDEGTTAFHALLVLVGWGDEEGLAGAELLVAGDENPFDGIDSHRLHDADLTFDRLADALSIGVRHNGLSGERVLPVALQLLEMVPSTFFQHGLERLLTSLAEPDLLGPISVAIEGLVADGQMTKASDLLPALATIDAPTAINMIEHFRVDDGFPRVSGLGVAAALGRIHTPESKRLLEQIYEDDVPGASDAARRALEAWPS